MEYELTNHAKKRMAERNISGKLLRDALQKPTKVLYDKSHKLLIKKLYIQKNQERLLLIAGRTMHGKLKIFTVIDTSKVKKYL